MVKIALKALSLAILIFSNNQAYAVTKIWQSVSNDLGDPANWAPAGVPTIADIAEFQASSISTAFFFPGGTYNANKTQFDLGTGVSAIQVDFGATWSVTGTGLSNLDSVSKNVNVVSPGPNRSFLNFGGAASALFLSTSPIIYNIGFGTINFGGTSTAGGTASLSPVFNINSTGILNFTGNSTGGTAKIILNGNGQLQIDHPVSVLSVASSTINTDILSLGDQLTVNNSDTQTLSAQIQNAIVGTGSFFMAGSGTTILRGTNTSTGGVKVDTGTIQVASSTNLGSGQVTISSNGTLAVSTSTTISNNVDLASGNGNLDNLGNSVTYSGLIFGPGALTVKGSGVTTLTNFNFYAGPTTIAGGTLNISSNAALGGFGNSSIIFNGTNPTLQLANSFTIPRNITLTTSGTIDTLGNTDTITGTITGPGTLTKTGTGVLFLTGSNNYGGNIVNQGTLKGTTNSIKGNIVDNAIVTFQQPFAGTYSGQISGPGSVNITGGGAVTFTGANSYTGGTTVDPSTTLIGNTTSLVGNIVDNGTVTFNQATNGSFNGTISGSGVLNVNQSGTTGILTLTGPNTYTGGTNVFAGGLQGTTTSLQGNINIVNASAFVDFNQNTNGTYAGVLSGPGAVRINQVGGTGVITFTGNNTYTGDTTIYGGTLSVSSDNNLGAPSSKINMNGGTLQFTSSLSSARSIILNANGTIDTQFNTDTLSGVISGPGRLIKVGPGTLILTGLNTYSGGTTISAGTLVGDTNSLQGSNSSRNIIDNGALVFNQNFDGTFAGVISGTGSVTKLGTGTLTLTGTNTYSGGTTITAGTLQGDTNSLQGNILDNSALIFNQGFNGTFNGSIFGSGTITKLGSGILNLATNSSGFTGDTFVTQGGLALNAILGGNVTMQNGTTLSGNGTVLGNLTILPGSTIAPGNSGIGTLNVGGNYVQDSGSTYAVDFNQGGSSDLINIAGTATLNGGDVNATSLDGGFSITHDYEILHANGGVNGTFDSVHSNIGSISPILIYDGFNVFLSFKQPFINLAETFNQRQVAKQLVTITSPTPEQAALLNELTSLSGAGILSALTSMSGEQFTHLFILAEESSQRFIRMLYDPLRPLMAMDPCCREYCSDPVVDIWIEGGNAQIDLESDSSVHGMKVKSHEIAVGGQVQGLYDNLTLGFAGYYEKDHTNFNIGGRDRSHILLGGVYGLYQQCNYYVLADLVFGSSNHKFTRPIDVGDLHFVAHSEPTLIQSMGYIEAGREIWMDGYCAMNAIALQPFIGLGVGVFHNDEIKERGASPVNLRVPGQIDDTVFSRVGVHLTLLDLFSIFDLGIDAAWQCRLSSKRFDITENFIEFGSEFPIHGLSRDLSTFDGTVNLTTHLYNWDIYLEANGNVGSQISSWSYLGGFAFHW